MRLQNGTLVEWCSGGSSYYGFVVGTCSYDNCGEDNAYVLRYVFKSEWDQPRKPYSIAAMKDVEVVADFPTNFWVAGHWSATPEDRCEQWCLLRDAATGHLLVIAHNEEKPDDAGSEHSQEPQHL